MDALRATFMFIGVFVHAATLGNDPIFNGITYASRLFRMEGFFLISGFLSAMLVRKYGASRTVRRRLASVGLPFVATLVLCNPLTLWLSYNFHNNPDVAPLQYFRGDIVAEPAGPHIWHLHLWFLVTLLVYALCTPAAFAGLSRLSATPAFDWIARTRPRTMTAIIAFVIVTTVVGRGVYQVAIEPMTAGTQHDLLLKGTVEFLPFFLTGLLLYLDDQRLLASFSRPAPLLLAVSGGGILAAEQGWIGAFGASTGIVLIEAVFAVALLGTLFAIAGRLMPRQRPAVRYMADASYTVYLFHYFWVYVFATALSFDPNARWPQMLLVTILTFGVTFAIHHFIILRVPLLRMIFNGKFPAGARSATDGTRGRHRAGARPQHNRPIDRGRAIDRPVDRSRSRSRVPATTAVNAVNQAGTLHHLPPLPRLTSGVAVEVVEAAEVTIPLSRKTVAAKIAAAGEAMTGRLRRADQDVTLVLHYAADPLAKP
jgi:glucan biosynthesis protein C